jgi:hypothetical protein
MKRSMEIALLVVLLPTLGLAQKKKHNDVPAVFETAHSVYVQAENGDLNNPGVSPADKQAIADVQDALHAWNRYELAVHVEKADLVFVVRKGQPGNAQDQNGLSGGQSSPNVPSPGTSRSQGQAGQPDGLGASNQVSGEEDRVRVYTVGANGKLVGPVWTREVQGGLDGSGGVIMQQLKLAVERAYPSPPPAATPAH